MGKASTRGMPLLPLPCCTHVPRPTCMGAGSSGRSTMERSSGSPGTICQWSNTDRQKAWPCRKGTNKEEQTNSEAWHSKDAKACSQQPGQTSKGPWFF